MLRSPAPAHSRCRLTGTALVGVACVFLVACASILGISEGTPGAVDGSADAACEPSCTEEGSTRCSGTDVSTCASANGCLQWSAPTSCATGAFCCAASGGACIPADTSHCFGCDVVCSGSTPACLPAIERCGCSSASCAAVGQGCNTSTGGCEACAVVAADTADVYVDSNQPPLGGDVPAGSSICPFRSITAALAYARDHANVTTVHVAAGTYTAPLETFPLQVRGVALIGAGSATTIVSGQATSYDHSAAGGPFNGTDLHPTVVLGEKGRASSLRGVTLQPSSAPTTTFDRKNIGALCDRGPITTRAPATAPPPDATVDDVVFGAGYSLAFVATSSPSGTGASGCSARVAGSRFLGGPGTAMYATAADPAALVPTGTGALGVALTVGSNDAADAVRVAGYELADLSGHAVFVGPLTHANINRLDVTTSDVGIHVKHAVETSGTFRPTVEIRGSSLQGLRQAGLWVDCNTQLKTFEGTSIRGMRVAAGPPASLAFGVILQLSGGPNCASSAPAILKARNNTIVDNRYGVVFTGSGEGGAPTTFTAGSDFGTVAEPGNNVLRCNMSRTGGRGYDLAIDHTIAASTFVGNVWDSAVNGSPNVLTDPDEALAQIPNGTDVALLQAATANVSVVGARQGTEPCPPQ